MALIKCHECGNEISTEAKVCPRCGAAPKYRPGVGIVAFAILAVLFGVYGTTRNSHAPTPQKTEAEIASNWRFQMGAAAANSLKRQLRDPESLEILNIFSNDKATVLCLKYRARNGFGGYNVEYQIITENGTSQETEDWNRYCTSEMYDVTSVKHLI